MSVLYPFIFFTPKLYSKTTKSIQIGKAILPGNVQYSYTLFGDIRHLIILFFTNRRKFMFKLLWKKQKDRSWKQNRQALAVHLRERKKKALEDSTSSEPFQYQYEQNLI
jgi:hypothetical protein